MGSNGNDRVSIIVPVYNVERYLKKCLDSLIRQTYKNMEIILVDDGSTDSTGNMCDAYQQCYGDLIKVEHREHLGVSHARLAGIRKAEGEYVAFVDGDDWIDPDYVVSMLSHMEGADIVAAGISRELSDAKESVVYEYNRIPAGMFVSDSERKKLYKKMLRDGEAFPYRFGVLPYMCNKLFRKKMMCSLLEKVDKRIYDGEDAAVVYPYLLSSHKIVLTNECKYHYVNHGDSASLKDSGDAYLNATYLYQELYVCFAGNEYFEDLLIQLDDYMRRIIWKKNPAAYVRVNSFIFPYDRVKQGSRIILYGMGKAGEAFYAQIGQSAYCNIVAWADREPKRNRNAMEAVLRIFPDEIVNFQFDYVIIALENKIVAHRILEKLLTYGIDQEKVIIPDL